jgi:hypothetical protein
MAFYRIEAEEREAEEKRAVNGPSKSRMPNL